MTEGAKPLQARASRAVAEMDRLATRLSLLEDEPPTELGMSVPLRLGRLLIPPIVRTFST